MTVFSPQPISPLDGRYRGQIGDVGEHLSEAGLNRARLLVEIEWVVFQCEKGLFEAQPLTEDQVAALRRIYLEFGDDDIVALGAIEATTRHDVKAVELFIRQHLTSLGLSDRAELVHICCTSEDINNLAYALSIKATVESVWLPKARSVLEELRTRADRYRAAPMLAHTHGQPATPTTMGKELAVFAHRLARQVNHVERTEYLGKFNGATGTFAAHAAADPEADWPALSAEFVARLGLIPNPLTTQIESHDWQAELYSAVAHAGRVLHNFCTDMWTYISLDYFHQIPVAGEVGSSTMPHKVNPIRFENAEANLELSAALLDSLATTLVTSRMQRDLTDSTSQRNIGVAFGHSLLALDNILSGLATVQLNEARLSADLDANWEVLAEAIQTVIRAEVAAGRSAIDDPYSLLKSLTRGQRVTPDDLHRFIAELDIGEAAKQRLQALTPQTYVGLAAELVDAEVPSDDH